MIVYGSTKTYGHEQGLSAVFRQHRADSHCRLLHGYALKVKLDFVAGDLDERNWVVDFGGLKDVKQYLKNTFDHKLIVAQDDPELDHLTSLAGLGLADVLVLPAVGCEAFASLIFVSVNKWLVAKNLHASLRRVTVAEHDGNSAYVERVITGSSGRAHNDGVYAGD